MPIICNINKTMNKRHKWIIWMLALTTTLLHADTFYVSPTGGHMSPFNSQKNAATNIQAAVDLAPDGAMILASAGIRSQCVCPALQRGRLIHGRTQGCHCQPCRQRDGSRPGCRVFFAHEKT